MITRGFGPSDAALWLLMVERGACSTSELSADDWYPVSTSAEAARREAAGAIAVCSGCPVREECLELALRNWAVGQHGVWGGTIPAERERLRAARVTQLTRVLARNRGADLAARRDAGRAASLRRRAAAGGQDSLAALESRASAGGFSRRPMMWTSTPNRPASWITCRRIGPPSVMCHPLRWIDPMTICVI